MDASGTYIVDVRPAIEFGICHLPTSRSTYPPCLYYPRKSPTAVYKRQTFPFANSSRTRYLSFLPQQPTSMWSADSEMIPKSRPMRSEPHSKKVLARQEYTTWWEGCVRGQGMSTLIFLCIEFLICGVCPPLFSFLPRRNSRPDLHRLGLVPNTDGNIVIRMQILTAACITISLHCAAYVDASSISTLSIPRPIR